jgi:glycosyltransferase involved in cell wall biosynthesis
LEAAARLVSENPELRLKFQIIGDGELRKNLEEYTCRLGLKDKADFLGWQKGLADIYDKLDIVALTSRNEGTPVSLVEAMASARPVVATDVGGVRDLLGEPLPGYPQQKENFLILERGVAVGPDDPQGFALALAFMLRNEDLRSRLICSARNFVKAQFNKQRLVKDTQDLYFDLCHKKTGV